MRDSQRNLCCWYTVMMMIFIYIYVCVCVCVCALVLLVSSFNDISMFVCYLMPKPSLLKDRCVIILPIARGKSQKVNIIAWLAFKLIYYNLTVQHVSHYATGTPHPYICVCVCVCVHTGVSMYIYIYIYIYIKREREREGKKEREWEMLKGEL